MRPILMLGASGHAAVLVDAIQQQGGYQLIGLLDPKQPVGTVVVGGRVLGDDADVLALAKAYDIHGVVIAIGDNAVRARLAQRILPIHLVTVQHPSALVAPSASLGLGCQLLARAVIQARAHIGPGCLVNTGAIVEHDCVLAAFSSVGPGAILCGGVSLGEQVMIGAQAVVLPGVTIGTGTVIGAGAVVTKNIPPGVVAHGNPCRVQRDR